MWRLQDLPQWEGSAEALADMAGQMLAAQGLGEEPVSPNVRLIRDDAQRGILSRPERRGKEAIYRYRHLLEFIAARALVADGWPLAKIAEHFAHAGDEELLALIPGQEQGNPALAAARDLMRKSGLSGRMHPHPVDQFLASQQGLGSRPDRLSISPTDPFTQRAARMSSMRADLRQAMARLGLPSDSPPTQQVTLIALAPWCHVLIETARLHQLTADEAEEIGRTVVASLLDPMIRKGAK